MHYGFYASTAVSQLLRPNRLATPLDERDTFSGGFKVLNIDGTNLLSHTRVLVQQD